MARNPFELRKEAYSLFLENFSANAKPETEYFHSFLCPIAIAEASVREYIVEDFDVLQLLALRLYDAGFRDPAVIASFSGMRLEMAEKALESEIKIAGHIDPQTGEITETGRMTLEANRSGKAESHVFYTTARRLQIEAATGTVIPAYLEDKEEYMDHTLRDDRDGIVPISAVEQDAELLREINERLMEYRKKDIFSEKATIQGFDNLHSSQILYRWAYLTKLKGMHYPMIVIRGRRSISSVNAESVRKGNYGQDVALPLAVARSDSQLLSRMGMNLEQILIREDRFFAYLLEKSHTLKLYEDDQAAPAAESEDAIHA